MQSIFNYLAYSASGLLLLVLFFFVYTRFTPYKETELLKHGNRAVAYFLSGSMLGFSSCIAVSIFTHLSFLPFLAWSAGALILQIVVYFLLNILFKDLPRHIEENNAAVGLLSGSAALCAGLINAASLYS